MRTVFRHWNRHITAKERRMVLFCAGVLVLFAAFLWTDLTRKVVWYGTKGIRARLFARPHVRTFVGQLHVEVPAGWIREGPMCARYSLSGVRKASMVFVARESTPLWTDMPAPIPFAVGGENATLRLHQYQYIGVVTITTKVVVPGKGVFMEFSGTREDWQAWEGALENSTWLPQ